MLNGIYLAEIHLLLIFILLLLAGFFENLKKYLT